MVQITHASIDENGKAKNGKAGDQSGKEVCTRAWYSKPWDYVIRFTDPEMRRKLSWAMIRGAMNIHIGYDQNQRNSLLSEARQYGYDPGKVMKDVETDCSALVALCCIYAGVKEQYMYAAGNSCTTRNLKDRLFATGLVQIFNTKEYTQKSDRLIVGDILLSVGHHVAVVTQTENDTAKAEKKTFDEVVKDVIRGKYGNMPERKQRVESEGYNYEEIREEVIKQLRLSR